MTSVKRQVFPKVVDIIIVKEDEDGETHGVGYTEADRKLLLMVDDHIHRELRQLSRCKRGRLVRHETTLDGSEINLDE